MAETFEIETWDEFENKLAELQRKQETDPRLMPKLLFRGQANAEWELKTTLERRKKEGIRLGDYYRLICVLQPEIETFTQNRWEIPAYQEVAPRVETYDFLHLYPALRTSIYGYMAHLRHHGFPSPLLDWTRSVYVAAYFAFANAGDEGRVAIYVLSEARMHSGSSRTPQIVSFGPRVKTHRRHFLQQCEYTMCMVCGEDGWRFAEHEPAFEDRSGAEKHPDNFAMFKFTLPAYERIKVLKMLDGYNLNAFSLFGSEESLMETLALRELHLSSREYI